MTAAPGFVRTAEVNGSEPTSRAWLRPGDAAEYLGLSRSFLAKLRVYGGGPEYHYIGRAVLYARDELDRFVRAKSYGSTSAVGQPALRVRRTSPRKGGRR
jgi:hypothetical protein